MAEYVSPTALPLPSPVRPPPPTDDPEEACITGDIAALAEATVVGGTLDMENAASLDQESPRQCSSTSRASDTVHEARGAEPTPDRPSTAPESATPTLVDAANTFTSTLSLPLHGLELSPTVSAVSVSIPALDRPHSAPPSPLGMAKTTPRPRHMSAPHTAHPGKEAELTLLLEPQAQMVDSSRRQHTVSGPDLIRVSQAARRRSEHKTRLETSRRRFHERLVFHARIARLTHVARSVQRTLAECVRTEDRPNFVNLFGVLQDIADDSWRAPDQASNSARLIVDYPRQSFIDRLLPASKAALLEFLSKLRHDGEYIADRMATLSQRQLLNLLPERSPSRMTDSVFGSSSWSNGHRTPKQLAYVVDNQAELLASADFSTPLATLIHCVRGVSCEDLGKDLMARDVWATVCARSISEQRPGCERLVPAVLDVWASGSEWRGKSRLQSWILQMLSRGAELAEPSGKMSFRMRVQLQQDGSSESEFQAEAFYTTAVHSLFDLLADRTGPSVIPQAVLTLCHAIFRRLNHSQHHQRALPQFVATRWLFYPFLFDAIVLPEAHGLVIDHIISDHARQRVLREIATRAQKAMLDVVYSWRHGQAINADLAGRVHSVLARLQDPCPSNECAATDIEVDRSLGHMANHDLLAITATDVVIAIDALYPQHRTESLSSALDCVHPGTKSSASSISGFSLFTAPNHIDKSDSSLPPPFFDKPTAIPENDERHDRPLTPRPSNRVENSESGQHHESLAVWLDDGHMRQVALSVQDSASTHSPTSNDTYAALVVQSDIRAVETVEDALLPLSLNDSSVSVFPDRQKNARHCQAPLQELFSKTLEVDLKAAILNRSASAGLEAAFELHVQDAIDRAAFLDAHAWSERLRLFKGVDVLDSDPSCLAAILEAIETQSLEGSRQDSDMMMLCNTWSAQIARSVQHQTKGLENRMAMCTRLRDKMWFVHDVKTSAAYDELRSVTGALRIMSKPKRTAKTRPSAPPLRHWSGAKLASVSLHLKSEAQILELLSAAPEQGGPNKLSDDQSFATSAWLDRNNVENFCRGEERLHKFCMEIRKCVDKLVAADSTVLSSNPLYQRDFGRLGDRDSSRPASPSFASLKNNTLRPNPLAFYSNGTSSIDAVSSTSHALSSISSRDLFGARSPALTNQSSRPFWSPAVTEARSPSSATSIGSTPVYGMAGISPRGKGTAAKSREQDVTERLRESLVGHLLSDLASPLFGAGSETDLSYWSGLGGQLVGAYLKSQGQATVVSLTKQPLSHGYFDFPRTFKQLLAKFSESSTPFAKLGVLYEINQLLPLWHEDRRTQRQSSADAKIVSPSLLAVRTSTPTVDVHVQGFRLLFSDESTRPHTLFRDMQYIASLVSPRMLDATVQGKAFWNAAVAMTELTQELRALMVETADGIIAYHSNHRSGHARSTSSAAQLERDSAAFSIPTTRTPPGEDFGRYSMADAATLLQITAREGDPVAQRELATLYLTHPELMDHILAPFARPRDVFKEELESKWRKNQDPHRCDPATMCVAHHWMSLSSRGGDALATNNLRQREEMDNLP